MTATAPAEAPARLFLAGDASLRSHLETYGHLPRTAGVLTQIQRSGLTGRGGAGYPTAEKLAAVSGKGARPVVVANGSEGEPASNKDQVLLRRAPHLVLDGLAVVADTIGARATHLVTAEQDAANAVLAGLGERSDRRMPRVSLIEDTFVAGEESAVVNFLEGRRAVPRDRRQRVYERGIAGRPTLVLNVETLAHIALIARYGAGWFREHGEPDDPGTFLATVAGDADRPGVYELARGTDLADLLDCAGGGSPQAVLIGGYHGTWVAGPDLASVRLSRDGLARFGARVGAGVVIPLTADRCGLLQSATVLRYLADQSAGQCGPCINGLPALASAFAQIARPGRADEVARLAALVTGRGACTHPDGTARFALNSLETFADEVELHRRGRCREGARTPH